MRTYDNDQILAFCLSHNKNNVRSYKSIVHLLHLKKLILNKNKCQII